MSTHRHAPSPAIPPIASEDHLSETQIDDCIIGDLATAPTAHLATCSACADRVAAATSSLTSFQTLSTTWSERLSAALPTPVPTPRKPLWQRHMALAAPCLVLVVGLTAIRSTYVTNSSSQIQPNPLTETATAADDSHHNSVSADDQMLNAIDADLTPDSDSPADLGLRPVSNTSTTPSTPSTPSTVRD